jgi:ESS family glutamate:Na+ symporter
MNSGFIGVVHLNIIKGKGKIRKNSADESGIHENIESEDEIPMQESIDKMTVQIALIIVTYMFTYFIMNGLGMLLPGMRSVIFGFNFIIGVLSATLVKETMRFLKKKNAIQKNYTNNFLLTRASNFFFDIMVVSGIAAIRLSVVEKYWGIMLVLGLVGLFATYFYNRLVAVKLFPEYTEEQFLMMYGMLTGTASTGTILLREIDGDFETPAADNMVYQNFPAIVFGFPMMLLATLAPQKPVLTMVILVLFFIVMNIILFRKFIFRFKKKKTNV